MLFQNVAFPEISVEHKKQLDTDITVQELTPANLSKVTKFLAQIDFPICIKKKFSDLFSPYLIVLSVFFFLK